MAIKKMKEIKFIEPLFSVVYTLNTRDKVSLKFIGDNYNKQLACALANFLNEYKDSPGTLRSYSKEVERLLLWCIHIKKTNLLRLKRDHLMEYQAFLKQPAPEKLWCGPSVPRIKNGKWNLDWRPCVTGLGPSSLQKTFRILDSFFNYLVQADYLAGNPLALNRRRKKHHQVKKKVIDRYLELDEIQSTLDALADYPVGDDSKTFQAVRARYIILLLFYSGLRIAEVANHCMGHFIRREGNWFLRIMGKGERPREIPVPDALRDAVAEFRLQVGLPSAEPKFREKTPLIPMHNLKKPISVRRIAQILKWAFHLGADQFALQQPQKASKLRQASAHWLRHSYVTYLLDSGAPLKVVQENAGHSDIATTMRYQHMAQTDRFEATRSLSLKKK